MPNLLSHNDAAEQLYRLVVEYDRRGDVYNAVKLCKRLARLAPDWSVPFAFLSRTYRSRMEWKPTFHYCLKAVEHNNFDENLWETLGIASTVLGEWETARYAWNQLGFHFKPSNEALHLDLGLVPVRLNPTTQPEIVAARRIDPVRASIESIPQPSSGRRYKDLILVENRPNTNSNFYQQHKKLPIHNELQLLKSSNWHTFSVLLHTPSQTDVDTLANLCLSANLGFDNWSNATRFFQPNIHRNVAEYFDQTIFGKQEREVFLVAIAAKQLREVAAVLESWRVITLRDFVGVEALG
ncbi:MAG: hypothetical protein K9J37_20945 [Saprospiraceae bacterium]|nr:hypothetical protein [Saprospiraceae bacterium]MCF8252388.1 hypothetical protein [Saprospiraceae bacterium]MCF8282258.1 hypothetical protein [Bacteroidales bacterium]MCF8313988.1 hypothetical protein [Saprospiraceae bacterium]MCF8442718.1 hypothetical protein [Saprospiraceae bacterium]